MSKRIHSLIIIMAAAIVVFACGIFVNADTVASGECGVNGDNVKWELDDNGNLCISGTGKMQSFNRFDTDCPDNPWEEYKQDIKTASIKKGVINIGSDSFYYCKNLVNVDIADTVTSIELNAFDLCVSLKKVNIPDSLQEIEEGAFSDCKSLEKVYIPDGVKTIKDGAFAQCDSLENVIIPSSVEYIGALAFYGCDNLTDVTVGANINEFAFEKCFKLKTVNILNGVSTIGYCAFEDCNKLEDINIPNSINSIASHAFSGCSSLTEIRISSAMTTLNSDLFVDCISLSKIIIPRGVTFINGYIFRGCYLITIYGYENSYAQKYAEEYNINFKIIGSEDPERLVIKDGDFTYYSNITQQDESYSFDYDDAWFAEPSGGFNENIAKLSMRLALAACRKSDVSIKAFYNSLGLSNRQVSFPEPYFNFYTDETTIGYAIASRTIKDDSGEDCDLVVVTVRSGGYKSEWGDNFKIGSGSEHAGFRRSADKVVKSVSKYIDTLNLKNAKILITGFSRGAAVSNNCAHQFNNWVREGKFECLDDIGDIYAYCFECPRNVRSDNAGYKIKESNIINVVNDADLVPKVAPEKWDFYRYGVDYFLPTGAYCDNFDSFYEKQVDEYSALIKKTNDYSDLQSKVVAFSQSITIRDQVSFTKNVVDQLATSIGTQNKYVKEHEENLCDSVATMKYTDSKILYADQIFNLVFDLGGYAVLHPKYAGKTFKHLETILNAHKPELCLSWIDSLNGLNTLDSVTPRCRRLLVNCPVDVTVTNSSGKVVAQIVNNEEQDIDSTIEFYVDENDQKVVVLPCDGEYNVSIDATDDGEMTYQVEEYNAASGETERVLNYVDVDIKEDDTLVGNIDKISEEEPANYTLETDDGVALTPTTDVSGDDVKEYVVTVDSSGDGEGIVTGAGLYISGEFAKLTAKSDYDTFEGWYQGDKLISTEPEYRFMVTEDVNIVGKFRAHTHDKVIKPLQKASFTKAGKTQGAYCSICGKTLVKQVSIAKATPRLSKVSYVYNGKTHTPLLTIKGLKKNVDYSVKWSKGRKNVGTYYVAITLKGKKYSGYKKLSYKINPKGTGIKSLRKGKKSFTAIWSKQYSKMRNSHITGYQLQYATNSKFTKGKKQLTIKGYKKTTKKISKLQSRKTYYVRVRTYMKVANKYYYSSWCKSRIVKTR